MAESNLPWQFDNEFVPLFMQPNVKYFERDGLETWCSQNKCQEFSENTDKHFEQRKMINLHSINEGQNLDKKVIWQYQTVDNKKIEQYPIDYHDQIRSSIFRNIQRNDLHVNIPIIKKHFMTDKQKAIGRGKFLKICKDSMYASCW